MILGTLNIDDALKEELEKDFTLVDLMSAHPNMYPSALLIDWIPPEVSKSISREKASYLIKQTDMVEQYVRDKLPVLIFDRWLGITAKEQVWFHKRGVKLFEPALNNRRDFQYLPFWIRSKKFKEIRLNDKERKYSLGITGDLMNKIRDFEKYYLSYGKLYPSDTPIVYDSNIDKSKEKEYNEYNIEKVPNIDLRDIKCTVVIGSKKDYRIGFMNPVFFEALENNCIPLMAEENRYFRGMVPIVGNTKDISFYVDGYENTYSGYLYGCYQNIERFYPEYKIEHTVDVIKTNLN